MNDIQRAMLGDHEAAARLTEQGVLIPCPCCYKHEPVLIYGLGSYSTFNVRVKCKHCGLQMAQALYVDNMKDEATQLATRRWNTRAPLLTPEQIDMLERMESKRDE